MNLIKLTTFFSLEQKKMKFFEDDSIHAENVRERRENIAAQQQQEKKSLAFFIIAHSQTPSRSWPQQTTIKPSKQVLLISHRALIIAAAPIENQTTLS